VCVSLSPCVSVSLPVKKLILIYLPCTCWHHEFEMTGSPFSWMKTMIWILRDFKPLLNLNLYGEHMPGERITGSKIDFDLSAYRRVYTVNKCEQRIIPELNGIILLKLHHEWHTTISVWARRNLTRGRWFKMAQKLKFKRNYNPHQSRDRQCDVRAF